MSIRSPGWIAGKDRGSTFPDGAIDSIAVRLCTHPAVKALCEKQALPSPRPVRTNRSITLPQRRCRAFPIWGRFSRA